MATKTKVRKCHICGLRPASTENGFCHDCQNSIDAERRRKHEARKADKYVTYRGVTVALRKNGGVDKPGHILSRIHKGADQEAQAAMLELCEIIKKGVHQ